MYCMFCICILFVGLQLLNLLIYSLFRVLHLILKRTLFKKKETLYFILGSSMKENNIFIAFYKEQFQKIETYFAWINSCHATWLLVADMLVSPGAFLVISKSNINWSNVSIPDFHLNLNVLLWIHHSNSDSKFQWPVICSDNNRLSCLVIVGILVLVTVTTKSWSLH